MPLAFVRDNFAPVFTVPAEWKTNGYHVTLTLTAGVARTLARPTTEYASHVQLQAEGQAIRYRIDGGVATATVGFTLAAGSIVTVPCPNESISVYPVTAGAIIQYQWVW